MTPGMTTGTSQSPRDKLSCRTMNPTTESHCTRDPVHGRRVAAIVLLLVAGFALFRGYLPVNLRDATIALLGVAFIVWAGLVRNSGLLVPGGILTGIGVGVLLRQEYGSAAFLFSMAGGFLLVSALSLAIFGRAKHTWWTVFPAGGLAFAGLMRAAGPDFRALLRSLGPLWPYILIAIALWLFFVKPRDRGGDADADGAGRT